MVARRRFVAYYSAKSGTNQLWLLDMNSGNGKSVDCVTGGVNPSSETSVLRGSETAFLYEWSPDGKTIASVLSRNCTQKVTPVHPKPRILQNNNFYATTPPTCFVRGLFHGDKDFQYSPNGSYKNGFQDGANRPPDATNQIYLVDVDTKRVEQLTKDRSQNYEPSWRPDGKALVFGSAGGGSWVGRGSTNSNLYMIDLKTRQISPLTRERGTVWDPNGLPTASGGLQLQRPFLGNDALVCK